ncbi:MAG: 4Fe-4S dicluster domain-containing protein [Deltaproteobacteria bacterium]|jgi:2-oxoglutarate ferredoxin oxidoreductase subunit delta|nr:4Fe-4S dicluster domain-containing protein [Deltaproteobacteria bacterium]
MRKLKIDSVHCKACGLCIRACPKKVLRLRDKINPAGYNYVVLEDEEGCISCACCALNCPDMAISVYKEA